MGLSDAQRSRHVRGDYTPHADPTAFAALRNLSGEQQLAERRGKDVRYLAGTSDPCFVLGQRPADIAEALEWMDRLAGERNGLKLMLRPGLPVSWERTLRLRVLNERLREVTMARDRMGHAQFAGTRRDQVADLIGEEPTAVALLAAMTRLTQEVLEAIQERGIEPKGLLTDGHRVTLGFVNRYLKQAQRASRDDALYEPAE